MERFSTLRLEGLTALHASGKGIRDISLEFGRGDFVVVTGRIGSGKTTLLRAIQGLIPAEGSILVDGLRVGDPGAFFVPPMSAYTPQVPILFSDTLEENLRLGLQADAGELHAAIEAAALERDVSELPAGLATKVGPRGHKLSGGQAQRSAAARMFLRRPAISFIDDMSSALDAETEELLWSRFFEDRSRTCVAVSHRRATLARATLVVVLAEGRVESMGRLEELLESSPEMRRLWG